MARTTHAKISKAERLEKRGNRISGKLMDRAERRWMRAHQATLTERDTFTEDELRAIENAMKGVLR
jgi:hypothetical protein